MASVELAGLERARREIIAGQRLTLFPLAEVDLSVLLVEDEDVSEVTGSEGREGLEVVAERGPCRRRVSLARHVGRHQEIHEPPYVRGKCAAL